jgi:hypothetical protein
VIDQREAPDHCNAAVSSLASAAQNEGSRPASALSTDDTAEQVIRSGLPSIRHERNRGVGAAIKSGLRDARRR